MTVPRFFRKPLIAAVLGAGLIGVPICTLYMAGAALRWALRRPRLRLRPLRRRPARPP